MPSLAFFIDEQDVNLLLDRLNRDTEIAFIVPDGLPDNRNTKQQSDLALIFEDGELRGSRVHPRRWKAVRTLASLTDGLQSLWHVPAGPLPLIEIKSDSAPMGSLMGPNSPPPYPPIADPWSGWTGINTFGSGCHPWIRLELWTRHRPYTEQERATLRELNSFWLAQEDTLLVSVFQWTGSYFRPAPGQTQRWWNRVKAWMDRSAVRLRVKPSYYAFPSALQKLKSGMRYYSHGFDLDEAIRRTGNPQ
jgi:hypothetical protein